MKPAKLPNLEDAERRIDELFNVAFPVDHPAMLDWVSIKFALKEFHGSKVQRSCQLCGGYLDSDGVAHY